MRLWRRPVGARTLWLAGGIGLIGLLLIGLTAALLRRSGSPAAPGRRDLFTPGTKLFVDPQSNARRQAEEWRATRPDDARQMDKIASGSQADWFGEWSGDIRQAVD